MGKWEIGRAFQIEKDKITINYEELVSITAECASQHLGIESEKDYFKAVTDSYFAKTTVISNAERGLRGWGRKKKAYREKKWNIKNAEAQFNTLHRYSFLNWKSILIRKYKTIILYSANFQDISDWCCHSKLGLVSLSMNFQSILY